MGQLSQTQELLSKAAKDTPGLSITHRPRAKEPARRLSKVETKGLCDDYEAGVSIAELGERYRLGRTAVFAHLRRSGIQTKAERRRLTDDQVTEAAKLYESGESLKTVAKYFYVNVKTMRKLLAEAGVTIRRPGRRELGSSRTA